MQIDNIKKKIIALYRKYYDFKYNWMPYGWASYEMSEEYWEGKKL